MVELCALWLRTCHLSWTKIANVAKKHTCHLSWLKLWRKTPKKSCNLSSVMLRFCDTKVEKLSSVMLENHKKDTKKADICHLSWSQFIENIFKKAVHSHSCLVSFEKYCSCNCNAVICHIQILWIKAEKAVICHACFLMSDGKKL